MSALTLGPWCALMAHAQDSVSYASAVVRAARQQGRPRCPQSHAQLALARVDLDDVQAAFTDIARQFPPANDVHWIA